MEPEEEDMEELEDLEVSVDQVQGLYTCTVCERYQPFTKAVNQGIPLGLVCTCAIELRSNNRPARLAARRKGGGDYVVG